MRMLVGDVGGTKTVLAVAEVAGDDVRLEGELRLASGAYPSFEALVRRYLEQTGARCEIAALAVAGPVRGNRGEITNLPWSIDGRRLAAALGWRSVRLLNDLEAVAWGIPLLGRRALAVLQPGEAVVANACVVAAGTGLGEAGMYWDGARHRPFATEGGHADFAPETDREIELLRWLRERHGHVSWERLVSGMGIGNIFGFLCAQRGMSADAVLDLEAHAGDAAAAVAAGAAGGRCDVCTEAMQLFASLYGREAGNAALKHMALGGVYLGGGIAPRHLDLLRGGAFLDGFLGKGRMTPLMRRMPVRVILEPQVPLIGAARFMTLD